ncbi:MAG: class I SAM-dependent methyltransferase [Tissierellaceae bacterium]|nr:class I SAM-dependent methyltransferase [Tissierellaceae bacterium]
MKENKYDDKIFYEKYSQMNRSKEGLSGAGEWETLKGMLPDFKGKRMLDLGCGYGWHSIYAMENGASSVVGIDISQNMLKVAKEKTHFSEVEYICGAIEDMDFKEESFDMVLSSLAFHYIKDYKELIEKINKVLKPNGILIFTVEHPVFTAYGTQDWYYDNNKEILHFPVDNYYYEGKRIANFLGEDVVKYHRTITTYLNTLLINNFNKNQIIEPQPSEEMLDILGMKDEMRRPMMLIISAIKC